VAAEPSTTPPDLLRSLDESLAGLTGADFFRSLARALADELRARCAFVCEFVEGNTRAQPLVFWYAEEFVPAEAYTLEGTPCERVLGGDIVAFERAVADHFPHHREELLAVMAESYLAIPMKSRAGEIMGHVAVIDSRDRTWAGADFGALKLCAMRATAELEHQRAERALSAANRALEERVAERTRELKAARDELEKRVEDRTATLSAVNTRLRHEAAARAEAEAALRRQEEAYRDLYEHAPNVYWSTGADGIIKRVNQRAAELFGIPPEELIGKPFTYLVADTPAGLPRAHKVFQRFLAGKPTFGEEFEFRGANGRIVWGSVNVLPIFDESGKPVATRTTLADITERKRAEEALQHRLDLEQLLTEVATVFVSARPDDLERAFERALARLGVWGRWDQARVFLYSPGRTEADLHYEWFADGVMGAAKAPILSRKHLRRRDELLDLPSREAARGTPLAAALDEAGAGGLIVVPVANSSAWLGMLELVTFGRPHHWLREDVQLLRLLGELMASTLERCAAERELESARRGAEAASQAKSEFLARMSHELRTPLNAILGYAQLLRRDSSLSDRQRLQVETMHRSGEHLLTLINEVLDLARVEAGHVEIEAVDTDLSALVRSVEAMFSARAEHAGLSFLCELAPECPQLVTVDDRRLRQVLINLLGNAVKFTPHGGSVSLRVRARATEPLRWRLAFEVADTGIGIAEDDLARIFQPFFQVGRSSAEGLGLGLAITRRLVEAMGGSIGVESEPGEGTVFNVSLGAIEPGKRVGVERRAGDRAIVGYRGRTRALLIADDTRENRDLLGSLLHPLGFEIVEADDGAAALEAIEARQFDLVLLDLVMPELDGFEVLDRVRDRLGNSAPKIAAVSANAFEETRQRVLAAGGDAFLTKPVDLDSLLATLGELLGLDWLYANEAPERTTPAPAAEAAVVDAVPGLEQLRDLFERAHTGDVVALGAAIDALPDEYAALARELRDFGARFDLRAVEKRLSALIERAEQGANPDER
jgi:PAS domain S-box-containing protein